MQSARRNFREVPVQDPDADLRQMRNDYATFAMTDPFRQGGKLREEFAVRHDGKASFIHFEERNAKWLISST